MLKHHLTQHVDRVAHYLTSMLNAYVSPDHVPIIQLYGMSF